MRKSFALALLFLGAVAAHAEGQSLRGVLGNGGSPSSNGVVRLRGTAGQAVVGLSSSPALRLGHGFWIFAGTQLVGVPAPPGGETPGFALGQAFPSPARGAVRFALTLPSAAIVAVAVFNAAGRKVGGEGRQLLDAGSQSLEWSPSESAPGVYFARFSVGGKFVGARRLVLMK